MSARDELIKEYMALNYPVETTYDDDGFFIRVPDLPGCESTGDTLEEAYSSIEEAKESWIGAALETRGAIPTPRAEDDFSGKFVVRVGPAVHRDLVRMAGLEGVSLNHFVSSVLARETGRFVASFGYQDLPLLFAGSSSAHTEELICTTKSVGDWTVYENVIGG